ncbi:hypothetical protein OG21DRAFT_1520942 [Imleria badia]|nr:hypothetical protein OG21DRAFT_1520942 [Imleria badia]
MPYLQRRYVDLIRQVSSKWVVNWDPPIPVEVRLFIPFIARSHISRWAHTVKSSAKRASCNIYDPDFQAELSKLGFSLRMNNHPPQEGGAEEEFILASKGAKRVDWSLGPEAGLAAASIKGQWQFEHGKRDALLIMCCPRLRYLPPNVILDTLYKVPKLRDKWLVTSVHIYPAFSMFLSNKCMRALSAWRGIVDPRSYTAGEKVSLALVGQVPGPVAATPGTPAGAEAGIGWWSDTDLLRKACDKDGNYCYTPLYTMKRPRVGWVQRLYREKEVEVTGDGSPSTIIWLRKLSLCFPLNMITPNP